jgi:hypothetical protein
MIIALYLYSVKLLLINPHGADILKSAQCSQTGLDISLFFCKSRCHSAACILISTGDAG